MNFAGALQDVGLPRSEFLAALPGFNLAVEAGPLAVIAAAFLLPPLVSPAYHRHPPHPP
jgi:hypothetical protein